MEYKTKISKEEYFYHYIVFQIAEKVVGSKKQKKTRVNADRNQL